MGYDTANFFNNNLSELRANAPTFTGEFGGFLIGGVFMGAGVVLASVPILVAAGIAVTASAASSFHKAGRSARNVHCLKGRACPPGSGGSGSGGSGGGGDGTGGAGGGPEGGVGGGAGGKVGGAVDPNDKLGPAGQTEFRYITADSRAAYTIRFENLETATFPAQEVIIWDDLDPSVFDLSSFSLGPILLPGRVVTPPPGVQSFTTTVNLAPELPAVLLINAGIDLTTGRAAWTFVTLDPNTNDLPEDGLVGFLPPNVNPPEGEGAVLFSIDYLPNLPTDTAIENLAEIYFDLNDPIITPVWSNRVDRDAPVTAVEPLPAASESPFTVTVAGSDAGSGLYTRYLYVSVNEGPFELHGFTTGTTFAFEGEIGSTYAFYSLGADFVANFEGPKTVAEAVTTVTSVSTEEPAGLPRALTLDAPYPNPARGAATLRWGLPTAGDAEVRLYDVLGREVARVVDRAPRAAGWHVTPLATDGLASGVYVVRLTAEHGGRETSRVQRLVVVR